MKSNDRLGRTVDALAAAIAALLRREKEANKEATWTKSVGPSDAHKSKAPTETLFWTKVTAWVNIAMVMIGISGIAGVFYTWQSYRNQTDPGSPRYVVHLSEVIEKYLEHPKSSIDDIITSNISGKECKLGDSGEPICFYYDVKREAFYLAKKDDQSQRKEINLKQFVETLGLQLAVLYERAGGVIENDVYNVRKMLVVFVLLDEDYNDKERPINIKLADIISDTEIAAIKNNKKGVGYYYEIGSALASRIPKTATAKYIKMSSY